MVVVMTMKRMLEAGACIRRSASCLAKTPQAPAEASYSLTLSLSSKRGFLTYGIRPDALCRLVENPVENRYGAMES